MNKERQSTAYVSENLNFFVPRNNAGHSRQGNRGNKPNTAAAGMHKTGSIGKMSIGSSDDNVLHEELKGQRANSIVQSCPAEQYGDGYLETHNSVQMKSSIEENESVLQSSQYMASTGFNQVDYFRENKSTSSPRGQRIRVKPKRLTAKEKFEKRQFHKMQRFEEQEQQLDDEIDDIDEEFKALFSSQDNSKGEIEEVDLQYGRNNGGDLRNEQFSAVEEEGENSEFDPDKYANLDSAEDEYERKLLMKQLLQNRKQQEQ